MGPEQKAHLGEKRRW